MDSYGIVGWNDSLLSSRLFQNLNHPSLECQALLRISLVPLYPRLPIASGLSNWARKKLSRSHDDNWIINKNDVTWCENSSKSFSLTEVCQGLPQVVKLVQCTEVDRSLGMTPTMKENLWTTYFVALCITLLLALGITAFTVRWDLIDRVYCVVIDSLKW